MGLLDGVSGTLSDAVMQNLTPDMVGALSGLLAHHDEAPVAQLNEISAGLGQLADSLQVTLEPNAAIEHAIDATAEAASVVIPANVDPNDFADHLGNLHDALQGVAADAAGRVQSPDPEVRASAQVELQQAQQIMDVLQSTISQIHDGNVQVIDSLHSNADGVHDDATVVGLADAHATGHADTDGGTSHAADHVDAAPAHEDVAVNDPSANSA